jgi:hypothetical protein
MQRIVKRFLLYNQRDSDGFKKQFLDFKQELQTCRYEILNGMKQKKNGSFHVQNLIHAGINILGDEIFKKKKAQNCEINMLRFVVYKKLSSEITLRDDQDLLHDLKNEKSIIIDKEKFFPEQKQKKTNFKDKSFYTIVRMIMIKHGLTIPKLTPSQKTATELTTVLEEKSEP